MDRDDIGSILVAVLMDSEGGESRIVTPGTMILADMIQ